MSSRFVLAFFLGILVSSKVPEQFLIENSFFDGNREVWK